MIYATATIFDGVPGLVHGFERRGTGSGETRAVARARWTAQLEPQGRLLLLRQVHGAAVHAAPWEGTPDGDAGWAHEPGQILGIETADCLPLLIVDPVARRVAAAHAGWRGSALRVAQNTVLALVARGSRAETLLAALGPAIGACCYEVGEELRAAFGPGAERFFTPGARGRPHLDVRAANEAQLLAAGLRSENVQRLDECTHCRPALYHSYRRDGPGAGRMLSFVGFARG